MANTITDPEPMATAVSASLTTMLARPFRPITALTSGDATPASPPVANLRPAGWRGRPSVGCRGVIDQDVLERVLAAAVRTGADFAEVYAEDKRSTSVGLDDGRVEQVTSGRDRGAGIRVVKGDTTGFAHTADLSEAGLRAAAEAAAAAASQGGGGARTIALDAWRRARGQPRQPVPRRGAQDRRRWLSCSA